MYRHQSNEEPLETDTDHSTVLGTETEPDSAEENVCLRIIHLEMFVTQHEANSLNR